MKIKPNKAMGTCEWIDLSKEVPLKDGIYKVYKYLWGSWSFDFIEWDVENKYFYSPCDERPFIEDGVTHWLKTQEPQVPKAEAIQKLKNTEVIYYNDELDDFIKKYDILIYKKYGNAIQVITEGLSESTLKLLRRNFVSQMKHIEVIL